MNPCGAFWWRDVFKLVPIFRGIISVKVFDGGSTIFWKHNWINSILSEDFPRPFSFSSSEDVCVQSFLSTGRLADNLFLPQTLKNLRR
jgi:hypothetical protein